MSGWRPSSTIRKPVEDYQTVWWYGRTGDGKERLTLAPSLEAACRKMEESSGDRVVEARRATQAEIERAEP